MPSETAEPAEALKIADVELVPFEPSFRGGRSYVMSSATQSSLHNALLRITLENGLTGIGEIARFPAVSREEYKREEAVALPALDGLDIRAVPSLIESWCRGPMPLRGISFALDYAWYDIVSQQTGFPLSVLLGGPAEGAVPEILSLSAGPVDEVLRTLRTDNGISPVIQIKLGVDSLATDIDCLQAVLSTLDNHQTVLADFNGALTLEKAKSALPEICDPRLYWEDPCREYDDNIALRRHLRSPLMIDMSLVDLSLFCRALADGVDAVCIKPAKLGGLTVARTARDMCSAAGLKSRIDGPWSGQLGAHAALALAIGAPPDHFIGSIDLTQPISTEHDLIARPAPGQVGPAA